MNPQNLYQQPQPPQNPQAGAGGIPPLQQAPTTPGYTSYTAPQAPPLQSAAQPQYAASEQYGIDYLNRIAPTEQRTVNRFAVFGLIGAVIMAAVFAIVLLSNMKPQSAASLLPALDARLQTLKSATTAQQSRLAQTEISEANASLSSALGSMDTEVQTLMTSYGIKKASAKTVTASEKTYLTNLTKKLDDAYQRGTLDRTYTAQMTYQLSLLKNRLATLKKASSSTAVQTFCTNSLKSIDLTLASYAAFDASKS